MCIVCLVKTVQIKKKRNFKKKKREKRKKKERIIFTAEQKTEIERIAKLLYLVLLTTPFCVLFAHFVHKKNNNTGMPYIAYLVFFMGYTITKYTISIL